MGKTDDELFERLKETSFFNDAKEILYCLSQDELWQAVEEKTWKAYVSAKSAYNDFWLNYTKRPTRLDQLESITGNLYNDLRLAEVNYALAKCQINYQSVEKIEHGWQIIANHYMREQSLFSVKDEDGNAQRKKARRHINRPILARAAIIEIFKDYLSDVDATITDESAIRFFIDANYREIRDLSAALGINNESKISSLLPDISKGRRVIQDHYHGSLFVETDDGHYTRPTTLMECIMRGFGQITRLEEPSRKDIVK